MMRRMSNSVAARSSQAAPRSSSASCASSISSSPVRVSVATVTLFPGSDEEQACEDGEAQDREGEQLRRAVPAAVRPGRAFLLRGHAIDEALELLDRLGLG